MPMTSIDLHAGATPADQRRQVIERASENWWAAGRSVNPAAGYDERMKEV